MSDPQTIKAFVCDLDADEGNGKLRYRPAESDEEILEAPSASLIFLDNPRVDDTEVQALFETKFPARVAGLSRIDVHTEYQYQKGHLIKHVEVQPEHDAVYKSRNEENGARLAIKYGYIPIKSPDYYQTTKLEEFGCYTRFSQTRERYEIAYNPKVVERRKKRRQNPTSRRTTKYLTVCEVGQISRQAYNRLNEDLDLSAWWEYHWTRYSTVHNAVRWITLFDMVYGPTAHRQLEGFQEVMELWRDDSIRQSTISCWANSWTDEAERDRLWQFFDIEKDFPKPRKRKLKMRKHLALTPLSPTTLPGIKASVYKDVRRHQGHKVRIWVDGETRPKFGNLKQVTQQGLVITEKKLLVGWPEIRKVTAYNEHWWPEIYRREGEEDDKDKK